MTTSIASATLMPGGSGVTDSMMGNETWNVSSQGGSAASGGNENPVFPPEGEDGGANERETKEGEGDGGADKDDDNDDDDDDDDDDE